MKIHHVLFSDFIGRDMLETLCNRLVMVEREPGDDGRVTGFITEAGNRIQCVTDPRDVNCNTCQHVWRNIRGRAA